MNELPTEPGGFLPPSLPSPAPSHASNASVSSNLPHPRAHPLRAGSAKEEAARRYVEGRLLHISRRYTKKFQPMEEGAAVAGYENMSDVSHDLGEVVDVLWLSGTPSLQIPYLLNIALSVTSYLPSFPPAPRATFALLRKLDHAFASLLKGEDTISGEILPGFESGKKSGMSRTDMVRCRSLVEATRVLVVETLGRSGVEEVDEDESVNESAAETDTMSIDESVWGEQDSGLMMDVGRVYQETMVQLGQLLEEETTYGSGH